MRAILISFIILAAWSCKPSVEDAPIEVPEYNLVRYDQALLSLDTTDIEASYRELEQKYPTFTRFYFEDLVPLMPNKEGFTDRLKAFLQAPSVIEISKSLDKVYGDFDTSVRPELDRAMHHYKQQFPDKKVPDIYTFISEYAYQTLIVELQDQETIGVGLDLLLGKNYPYKNLDPKNPAFSEYLTNTYDQEHLVKKVMEVKVLDLLGNVKKNQMLDYMIQNGKKLYILDKLMPDAKKRIIMELPQDKMDWLEANEKRIYAYFLEENLFYESNMMKINKYIFPSPYAPGMPQEAPGRTANYIGWKIIDAFMKKHPNTSIDELINMKDAQEILKKSKYKPAR